MCALRSFQGFGLVALVSGLRSSLPGPGSLTFVVLFCLWLFDLGEVYISNLLGAMGGNFNAHSRPFARILTPAAFPCHAKISELPCISCSAMCFSDYWLKFIKLGGLSSEVLPGLSRQSLPAMGSAARRRPRTVEAGRGIG